jgi:pimeloyl-ACP methyl ester carboxylesterase
MGMGWLVVVVTLLLGGPPEPGVAEVRLALNERHEVAVADLVGGIASAAGIAVDRPKVVLSLPMTGLGAPLSKRLLAETLGADITWTVNGPTLVATIPESRLNATARRDWEMRLRSLVERAERGAKRRDDYGMHALKSYRPNDPSRPTVCLIHGLNSTSSVFWHMIAPIEEAGYGLVVYDFPYNRDLDESTERFRRDWAEFRRQSGDKRPWGIVSHSMGTLLARSYVEDDKAYRNDVSSLIMIAPVNGGSNLSKAQTLLQLLQGLKAVNRGASGRGDAMAHLSDGLGAAAEDMTPGSAFLKTLNARKRRAGVPHHTLAGDGGFLSPIARREIERQFLTGGGSPLLGGLARLATANLSAQLDEISEGTGDGAVAVAATRLEGVDDHVVVRFNHLELIRAPLLFPEPGPVVSMPYVLRWLAKDLPIKTPVRATERAKK